MLKDRTIKTPAGEPLVLPTEGLADMIAREWRIEGSLATRLAFSAIDGGERARVIAEIIDYAGHDLVCYPAEAPASLAARQEANWGPLRAWAGAVFGLRLVTAVGISAPDQPEDSLAAITALLASLDPFRLVGLLEAVRLFGSVVLALALMTERLDAQAAHAAARLEEAFQQERWGEDAEAMARAQAMLDEALLLQAWLEALRGQD
jgi:chaperone required for assembly of F1-ATPase